MERKLYVNVPEYHQYANKPRNFADLVARLDDAKQCGIWQVIQRNKYTGDVEVEQWLKNNWSDNGASVMIKAVIGPSAPSAFTPANIMAIDASLGVTTLSAAIPASSTVTSIQVNALTGPTIPSGTKLLLGAGTSNTMNVTLTQAITGSGTFTVTSTTSPAAIIPIGANVRYDYSTVPTADLSSLSAPVSYTSALPTGQFTYASRQVTVTNSGAYVFSTTGSPVATAGSYTAGWLTNTNPVSATTQTVLHVAFDAPVVVGSTSTAQITIVEKL